ncbi:MAG: zinc ribbon domain-containing protein [Deltaproteobacteria bacterium]|nr:zinc ribbon domain-containing protein [Deltaproteobacteria bacterium]MBW1947005.1 zinc ribbon domain-containing protein [Deltaproteobacteria bacterium]MBW1967055.1 zinc ribbon domain-containing protein [Deltaproteobacteria bacterium]MBW2098359.1 zinc ribbon domain-containing protein [Deltaproteobacteria bacterium]
MPIYEYECESCGEVIENWQKFSDAPLTTCKSCGGKLHKLISHSSFHLKGSGWYVTDYGGKKSGITDSKKSESDPDKKSKKDGNSSSGSSPSSSSGTSP